MPQKIFLLGDDGKLLPMSEQAYDSEDVLQELLEKYHDLLAGDQMNGGNPRRWLLIKREMEVPDEAQGCGRWSLDHLFLDQDGVLTLVEVKRATDTRARREVVAQMLDYAANAVLYWPIEKIISCFEETARLDKRDPEVLLASFLAGKVATSPEEFWKRVKTNLEAERIRMVFIADIIPRELQRIVEFLNDQMDPAEVLAVEVKQFQGEKLRTLVPRVVGQTVKSESKGSVRETQKWDHEKFMAACAAEPEGGPDAVNACERIVDWFTRKAAGVRWGNGKSGTFTARALMNGLDTEIFRVFCGGGFMVALGRFDEAFGDAKLREEFRKRLLAIPELEITPTGSWPGGILAPLKNESTWGKFENVLRWLIPAIKG